MYRSLLKKTNKLFVTILFAIVACQLCVSQTLNRGFGWPLDPSSLDPHAISSDTLYSVTKHFLSMPIGLNEDGSLAPGLVERWEINETGDVITLHIRPDATWSDGVRITAETFKYSLTRALQEIYMSDAKPLLFQIKNAAKWAVGDQTNPLGIEVLDELTLELTLEIPSPLFLYTLTHPISAPIPMHQLGSLDEPRQLKEGELLVSSGPYKLQKVNSTSVTLVANDNYYGDKPYFKEVNFTFDEYKNLLGKYLNNEIEILDWVDRKQYDWIKENKPNDIYYSKNQVVTFLVLGELTEDQEESLQIRKAILSVLKEPEMNTLLSVITSETFPGLIPWKNPAYDGFELPENYLWPADESTKMMEKLGYSKNNRLKLCMTAYNSKPDGLLNYIHSHLNNIHIELDVQHVDNYNGEINNCGIGLGNYGSRINSEEEMIDIFFENGMFRGHKLTNEGIINKYNEMKQSAGLKDRLKSVSAIESMLFEQYHAVMIQNGPMLSLVKPTIASYEKSSRSSIIGLSQFLRYK